MIFKRITAIAATLALALVAALPAAAQTTFYVAKTDLTLGNGILLRAMPGSAQDVLTVGQDSLTVTVPAGEVFILHAPYGQHRALENDSLFPTCNIISSNDNQMLIRGPRTVTVTPSQLLCSTADSANNKTPAIILDMPSASAALAAGSSQQLFFQNSGNATGAVRLRLSTDGGQSWPTVLADNVINNGYVAWTVPSEIYTTAKARLRLDGINGTGEILAVAVSPADFTINGQTPPTPPSAFDPAAATIAAGTIDINQSLAAAGTPTDQCPAGLRIKGRSSAAVYFCGADGKRHAFPNQRIHDSWYAGDFAGVYEVNDASLANVPLGKNVLYRPGVRMVKIQTDPKTYAVDANGGLRWIKTEAAAQRLYGADWNQMIDDVPDVFFTDYTLGEPIE